MPEEDKKRGLYRKYYVRRLGDAAGKHKRCFNFVLDLDHDPFAIPALKAYIAACEEEYPLLAEDLDRAILATPIT